MTRVQILLETKEINALRRGRSRTGKSYSQLVREAIDNTYVSSLGEKEIARMALGAKRGKNLKKFKTLESARRYLWSL